ncbi:hypothetical protein PAHAL_2G436700 [Panicum hallii]|uniref:Uncharacterized protein n=1 Tax=Panicum hallii TaxID=206008 RepID=A0A2T8KSK7_9POAL|nr:hypothetical protein PAHAL_2G436700 [Panicum hallii]
MPLPAAPRRCRPHRTKSDADWPGGTTVTPRPARPPPPAQSPRPGPASWTCPVTATSGWSVLPLTLPPARRTHPAVWWLSGAARSDPMIPIPSHTLHRSVPSRPRPSTPATGAGTAQATATETATPSSPLRQRPAPWRHARIEGGMRRCTLLFP